MQSIETNETEHTTTITGYDAELIKLLAERVEKTPEEFVLSFFEVRCIAPRAERGLLLTHSRNASFCS